MPNIEFGKADRDNQVYELLVAHSPISHTDFANIYESEYGVLSSTVLANYMSNFDIYLFDKVYRIDTPALPIHLMQSIKNVLVEDFYLLSDLREFIITEFPQVKLENLNPITLKSLGFKIYTNYVIKDTFLSAAKYFQHLFSKSDVIDTTLFPNGIHQTSSYMSEIYKFKASYQFIEFEPRKFISLEKLENIGVNIDVIRDYCDKAISFSDDEYFTIYSLKKNGFSHFLNRLGFDEWFYSSLIAECKSKITHRRIGGNRLFRKGNEETTTISFIEWILYNRHDNLYNLDELCEFLKYNYNMKVDKYNLIETVKGSNLFYENVYENLYLNYNVFINNNSFDNMLSKVN